MREGPVWITIAYKTTISTCEEGLQGISTMAFLREMQHMTPEAITYYATIRVCEKDRLWITATLREM